MIFELYKKEGQTPLEAMEEFRKENLEYKDQKMTYAGRLDPMAEGVLLILTGEDCKEKQKYLGLNKEYEFEILWGFQTDTYDILGIPTWTSDVQVAQHSNILKNVGMLGEMKGKFIQKYPPYSSMTVNGKQLFQWAREGRLDEIKIPEQEVEVYSTELLGERYLSSEELMENILRRIDKVNGDFRQEEIKNKWSDILSRLETGFPSRFLISRVKIKCSGGTYIRGIVNDLGGTVFSLKRTKIYK